MSNLDDQMQYESNEGKSAAAVADDMGSADPASDITPAKSYEKMRSSPRKHYRFNQQIAPMHGGLLPAKDEYFNVECNDISQGGISFYLKRPPGCEQFAIVLGQKPMITILVARVVYSREVEHDCQQMYLVGCQFIDRLQK
ncbi:MAG: PilZ domain-containing protein [Thermoguttaceae bacterium]|jgi:hypothetical protein